MNFHNSLSFNGLIKRHKHQLEIGGSNRHEKRIGYGKILLRDNGSYKYWIRYRLKYVNWFIWEPTTVICCYRPFIPLLLFTINFDGNSNQFWNEIFISFLNIENVFWFLCTIEKYANETNHYSKKVIRKKTPNIDCYLWSHTIQHRLTLFHTFEMHIKVTE